MVSRLTVTLASLLAVACAGATSDSPFEFGPSDSPLHYDVTTSGDVVADTPMGRMTSESDSDASVLLEIGGITASGRAVTATFEALEVRAQGTLGGGTVNADGILGKPYTGTLSDAGLIQITESPRASGRLSDNLDPAALLTELLVPLPPAGSQNAKYAVS